MLTKKQNMRRNGKIKQNCYIIIVWSLPMKLTHFCVIKKNSNQLIDNRS